MTDDVDDEDDYEEDEEEKEKEEQKKKARIDFVDVSSASSFRCTARQNTISTLTFYIDDPDRRLVFFSFVEIIL